MTERAVSSGGAALPGLESVPRADLALIEGSQPALVDMALRGPLVLTRHGRDAFVILPADHYAPLLAAGEARRLQGPPVIEG